MALGLGPNYPATAGVAAGLLASTSDLLTLQNALGLFRHPNLVALLGDSREAQYTTGANASQLVAAKNHRPWGNALAGSRAIFVGLYGVSGDRSDQMLARLQAALATGCGVLDIQVGTNDIGAAFGGYTCLAGGTGQYASPDAGVAVTLTNVAKVVFDNIMVAVNNARLFGVKCIVTLEAGNSGMTQAQIGCVIELNERLREAAESPFNTNMILFDLPRILWNLTGSSTAITFKTGYMTSGEAGGIFTHEDPIGAYAAASDPAYGYASILTFLMPPLPRGIRSTIENPTINPLNLLPNPLFNTTTGGVLGTGITGTVPSGWATQRVSGGSGTQTMVVSTGTPADGSPGNELIANCTFSAAGDGFNFYQSAGSGLSNTWLAGQIYDMSCVVVSDGSTVLAGAFPYLQFSSDTATTVGSCLQAVSGPGGWVSGPTGAYTVTARVPPITIPSFNSRSFAQGYLRIIGSAAGTAQVRFRVPEVKLRFG